MVSSLVHLFIKSDFSLHREEEAVWETFKLAAARFLGAKEKGTTKSCCQTSSMHMSA